MSSPWTRPRRFDFNLVVIGAGTAGLVSALVAAKAGAKVMLVEARQMGGDCLNTGCVPSKALIHAARLVSQARAAERMGLLGPMGTVDPEAALRHVRESIAEVAPHDSAERYKGFGIDVRHGYARITSPWTVEVDGVVVSTRAIILATGAEPVVPPIPGLEDTGFLTSETLWNIERIPRRLLVLGGGPIGCELSQAFARLGADVTIVQRSDHLLEREDDDVAALVQQRLVEDGVRVLTGSKAVAAECQDGKRAMLVERAGKQLHLDFDTLLIAVGRKPRTRGFGLEELGIKLGAEGHGRNRCLPADAASVDLCLRRCRGSVAVYPRGVAPGVARCDQRAVRLAAPHPARSRLHASGDLYRAGSRARRAERTRGEAPERPA